MIYQTAGSIKEVMPDIKIKSKAILIWRFEDVAETVKQFCKFNGGNEKWLAAIPPLFKGISVSFLDSSYKFDNSGSPDIYEFGDGWKILVGRHN